MSNLMMTSIFPEAKLLRMPIGDATLRAQLRRFKRERGCRVVGVRTSGADFAEATRLAEPLALGIEEDETVRIGHLVLVGDDHRRIIETE